VIHNRNNQHYMSLSNQFFNINMLELIITAIFLEGTELIIAQPPQICHHFDFVGVTRLTSKEKLSFVFDKRIFA